MSNYQFIEKGRIIIENARIIFANFSGRPSKYNKEGDRNFCVIIDDPDIAQNLAEAGWNVRILKPRDEDEIPNHYIPVAISFRSFPSIPPADVHLISSGNMTHLKEDTINVLDGAEATNIDLTIRPRYFTDDKTGEERIKAYLHDMYVTVAKNRLAEKYAEMEHPEDY